MSYLSRQTIPLTGNFLCLYITIYLVNRTFVWLVWGISEGESLWWSPLWLWKQQECQLQNNNSCLFWSWLEAIDLCPLLCRGALPFISSVELPGLIWPISSGWSRVLRFHRNVSQIWVTLKLLLPRWENYPSNYPSFLGNRLWLALD